MRRECGGGDENVRGEEKERGRRKGKRNDNEGREREGKGRREDERSVIGNIELEPRSMHVIILIYVYESI